MELARLEAVLFLSREPVPSRKLAQLANLADGTQARSLVRQLRKQYDARGTAFQVEEVAGGFQLLTRRKFAPWLRRLDRVPGETRLSQPALETLAVVAYRQPVLRAEIEAIRGVQCGEILRQLMERDLVRIVGRAEELGRPFLYGTTKRFLQLFGLKHLEEIPRAEQLRHEPGHETPAVANQPTAGNDIHSDKANEQVTSDEEVSPVTTTEEMTSMEELMTAAGTTPQEAVIASQVMAYDDDEDVDEDYDYDEDEEDEDYEYEDDEEEYEDEDEEDEDEEEEELEGDWEEVEDDEEDEDEEEYEDEDEEYEDDEEEYEDNEEEDYEDEDWDDED